MPSTKVIVLSLAICFFLLKLSTPHDSHFFSAPFFFWSEETSPRFNSQKPEILTTTEVSETQSLFELLLSGFESENSQFGDYLTNPLKSEVTVIYVIPQMRSDLFSQLTDAHGKADGGCFGNLKSILESSSSSLSIPYMKLDQPFSASLEDILVSLQAELDTEVVLPSSSFESHSFRKRFGPEFNFITHENFLTKLSETKSFSKEKSKLIIVGFEEELPNAEELVSFFGKQDGLIGRINQKVKALTEGKYLGVFSAERSYTDDWMMETVRTTNVEDFISFKYLEALDASEPYSSDNTTNLYDTYWPPAVWEGLMLSILMLLLLLIGLSCTCDIQVPKMFSVPAAHKKKE